MSEVLTIETPRWAIPLTSPARYKGAYGGRGGGKSEFFCELGLEDAVRFPGDAGEGLKLVCIREIQKSLKFSAKSLIERKLIEMGLGEKDGFKVHKEVIETPKDGIIIFQGMQDHTADSIKSLDGFHRAFCEEAQSLSAFSLSLLRPTLRWESERLGLESELWFAWNPRFETDAVDVFFRKEKPPAGAVVVPVSYLDNPWFPKVLREEMEYDKARDPDKYIHVWLGGYQKNSEARVFKNWKVEEFESPAGAIFRLGADWGFSVDPSVLIRAHIDGKKLYIDYEAYRVGCDIDFLPDLFRSVPEAEKWPITADSARPETISYMQRHGFPHITPAIKGPKSIEDGVEFLKSYDIIVHPRCRHTIDELTLYSYKVNEAGIVLPILEDKHNHVIDALRYACEAARKVSPKSSATVARYVPVKHGWMG